LSSGGKKWLFWFFQHWNVFRKKPNVPFSGRLFYTDAQRLALAAGGELDFRLPGPSTH